MLLACSQGGVLRAECICCAAAGAALIKYGSLVFELPFHPNVAVALTLVLGTPAAYSLFLLTKGDSKQ
jgi:hypothetical protein